MNPDPVPRHSLLKLKELHVLDNVKVAKPCPANWNDMQGSDTVRHCSECRLNVYNLSGMTRSQAEELLKNHEGRLCVRYYARADGRVITRDCPKGLATARVKLARGMAFAATLMFSAIGATFFGGREVPFKGTLRNVQPFKAIYEWVEPDSMMGETAIVGRMPGPPPGGP